MCAIFVISCGTSMHTLPSDVPWIDVAKHDSFIYNFVTMFILAVYAVEIFTLKHF